MARYLIGTALTLRGTVKKQQPADKFRKMLIRQKIPFSERKLPPNRAELDSELKSEYWDHEQKSFSGDTRLTFRDRVSFHHDWVTEFTFHDTQTL